MILACQPWSVKVLSGRVESGVGDLARWMIQYADLYEERTGVRLFPGSLNIVLNQQYRLPLNPIRLEPHEYGGRVGMNIVPCKIMGVAAFILRTDRNEAGLGDHDRNVIEIAAAVRLRDALGLTDGEVVDVEVDHAD